MSRRRDPGWRDEAAAALMARRLPRLSLRGRALVLGDPRSEVADALTREGLEVRSWWRRGGAGRQATVWPDEGACEVAALRLPRAKDELEMTVHAAAAQLEVGGTLLVYGAKDEGIGSAARRIEPVFGSVRSLATGGHCRILAATRPDRIAGHRPGLEDWRLEGPLELDEISGPWVSYPGVFAHGRVDRGTRMLLDTLPPLASGDRVLDFGCGSGIVAAVARARTPDLAVDCLDVDAVALAAARENVPGARFILGDGLGAVSDPGYDWILSNPPYHTGKAESLTTVRDLVSRSPAALARGGRLIMVVQRRLPAEEMLAATFDHVRRLAANATYRVWEAY